MEWWEIRADLGKNRGEIMRWLELFSSKIGSSFQWYISRLYPSNKSIAHLSVAEAMTADIFQENTEEMFPRYWDEQLCHTKINP